MRESSGSSDAFVIELFFLYGFVVPRMTLRSLLHLLLSLAFSTSFKQVWWMLVLPSRKRSHCFTLSIFTEIPYLGNKIALLSPNINTKYIKFQTDTRNWPTGEPLLSDYPHECCSSLRELAQRETSHLSISHIWACFHIPPPATITTLPFNKQQRCVVWIRYVFFLLVLFSIDRKSVV